MLLFAVLTVALGMGGMSGAADSGEPQVTFRVPASSVSPEVVTRALAPLTEAIAQERRRQAELPPAETDGEKLVRLGRLDQVARTALSTIDLTGLSPEEANAVRGRALGTVEEVDLDAQAQFKLIARPDHWFSRSEYGEEASRAAFLVVQHADEDLWRQYLPLLEPLVGTGEINDAEYALMYDRLAVSEGRPQRYGSQFTCNGPESRLADLEDPESVDARRAAMGMTSMAENARRFEHGNPCQMFSQR